MVIALPGEVAVRQGVYEGLFIFDANRFTKDREAIPQSIEKLITDGGGEIVVSRLWEERRLAYPINGQRKGVYWLIYFRGDTQQLTALNRACEIDDNLLRHLVLKIHPRLVEPILAHAQGAPAVAEEAVAAETAVAEPVAAE